jgi:hypothetical protein
LGHLLCVHDDQHAELIESARHRVLPASDFWRLVDVVYEHEVRFRHICLDRLLRRHAVASRQPARDQYGGLPRTHRGGKSTAESSAAESSAAEPTAAEPLAASA